MARINFTAEPAMIPTDSQTVALDEKLSVTKAAPLFSTLKSLEGQPVRLDAAAVTHIDMSCAQILLAAFQHWSAADIAFSINNPSDGYVNSLTTLGLTTLLSHTGEPAACL